MFKPKYFSYAEAVEKMKKGFVVVRRAWHCSVVGIIPDNNSRFCLLISSQGVKHWEPYFEDFSADDWHVRDHTGGTE